MNSFLYFHHKRYCYRKSSLPFIKKFLLWLCEKYPQGFSDNYFILKNTVLSDEYTQKIKEFEEKYEAVNLLLFVFQ